MDLKTLAVLGIVLVLVIGFSGCTEKAADTGDNESAKLVAGQPFEKTFGGEVLDSEDGDQPPSPPA